MPIRVQCPGCGSNFRADDKLAGKRVKCPKCPALIEVRSASPPQPAQSAPGQKPLQMPPAGERGDKTESCPAREEDVSLPQPQAGTLPRHAKATESQATGPISRYSGVGSLIGAVIGGINHGIMGAMVGGVLGSILVSSGIEVDIRKQRAQGRLSSSRLVLVLSYLLGAIGAFAGTHVAMLYLNWQSRAATGAKPGDITYYLIRYIVPAFIGGIAALIPVWVSGTKSRHA